MRNKIRVLAAAVALLALFLLTGAALAHPLGNFTISRYSEIVPGPDGVAVLYIVDMAEIPTFQERELMDAPGAGGDGDGQISAAEEAAYLERIAPELAAGLRLTHDGRDLPLQRVSQSIAFPPGQGDLPTMRIELALRTTARVEGALAFEDTNFPGRLGWREIVVVAGDGATLSDSSAPMESLSARLTTYPADLLATPPDVSSATFAVGLTGTGANGRTGQAATAAAAAAPVDDNRFSSDEFANLLNRTLDTPAALAAAMFVAIGLGAAHALTPGHGKTIVGAYLVGSRGTGRHALFLGLTTTITHTAGVFILGFIVLFASKYILPERLYPWLGVLSGLLVVFIGASILRGHIGHWLAHRRGETHGHEHYHFHLGKGQHHHHGTPAADPRLPGQPGVAAASGPAGLSFVGLQSGGGTGGFALAPARVVSGGSRNHDHDHPHTHEDPHDHDRRDDDRAASSGDAGALGWRNLLALGISGGLLPCPSALVLMLSAIALGQVGLGMALILAFSVGLAGVLTGIGLILVYAGKLFDRVPAGRHSLARRVLPIASAMFVTLAGVVITVRAVMEVVG